MISWIYLVTNWGFVMPKFGTTHLRYCWTKSPVLVIFSTEYVNVISVYVKANLVSVQKLVIRSCIHGKPHNKAVITRAFHLPIQIC